MPAKLKSSGPTEAEFTRQVIQYAQLHHWLVAHFRPGRTAKGWRTPVQADGAGFPDLILVREDEVIAAELKRDKAGLSPEQRIWFLALVNTPVATYIWRPEDWPQIERVLRDGHGH